MDGLIKLIADNIWAVIIAALIPISVLSMMTCSQEQEKVDVQVQDLISDTVMFIDQYDMYYEGGYNTADFDFPKKKSELNDAIEKYKDNTRYEDSILKLRNLLVEVEKREQKQIALEKKQEEARLNPPEPVISYEEIGMPKEMAESPLFIRYGVDDFNGNTVSDIFLTKEFDTQKQLDGTVSTIKFKKSSVVGNTYDLIIQSIIYDDATMDTYKIENTFTFTLIYQDEMTYYDKVKVENHFTGGSDSSTDFNDKAAVLMMIFSKE